MAKRTSGQGVSGEKSEHRRGLSSSRTQTHMEIPAVVDEPVAAEFEVGLAEDIRAAGKKRQRGRGGRDEEKAS
jgi:hypothetical protein